jgi:tetratricopeptide (TPR) repeat protein
MARPIMNSTTRLRFRLPGIRMLLLLTVLAAPASADDLKDGRAALASGQLDKALQSFEKAAAQGLAEGRAGVGQVHLRRRNFPKATEAFQQAQKMDPNLAVAWWGQGEVLKRQEKCPEAIPFFQKATEIDRKFPDAQLALGECLVLTKQFDKGVAALQEGLKWGPKVKSRFLVALGNAEMSRDSLRDAGIYFTQAREAAPTDPGPRKALGDFYIKRAIPSLAVPEYQAAFDLDTTDIELRFALGQAFYYDRRYNEALEIFKGVVAREPEFSPGLLAMGNLLYLAGAADASRYPEALPPLEKYTKLAPEDPKGWSLLGRTLYALKRKDEAVVALEKASAMGDKSKEMFTVLGRAYADRKDWGKAIEAFNRGEPSSRDLLSVGQMYVFMGATDTTALARADSVYLGIIEKAPGSTEAKFAINERGKLAFRRKDYAGAIKLFQERIALDPENDEAYYYIGLSYKEMKQYGEALTALRSAAALSEKKEPRFDRYFWLGILYAQVDSVPQATQAFERAVQLDSTSALAGKAYRQLGFYQLLKNQWADATSLLARAVQLDEKDVQAWVWLGQGYQNAGNRSKALEAYRRALDIDPRQGEAQRGVQSLQG